MKRRRRLHARSAAVILAIHPIATSTAQIIPPEAQVGSRVPIKPKAVTGAARAAVIEDFGKCVFNSRPDRADYFLRHSDDVTVDPALGDVSDYLRMSTCVGQANLVAATMVGIGLSVDAMRGWMAENAYRTAQRTLPVQVPQARPRAFFSKEEKLEQAMSLAAFADCIVAADPAGADALIRTSFGSLDEKAAAQALAPALGGCIRLGDKIALKIENIRRFAATGLWQRYEAAKPERYEGRP